MTPRVDMLCRRLLMRVRISSDITQRFRLTFLTDCGWIFAQHFCNRLGPAYLQLRNALDEANPAHAEVLNDIKRRFREETFTRESIANIIHAHPDIVSLYRSTCSLLMTDRRRRFACSMSTSP